MKRADPLPATRKSLHVGVDWLNTTWRIAVPVMLGAVGGLLLDMRFTTGPWLTLLGTLAGFVLAAKLVAMLLKEVESEDA